MQDKLITGVHNKARQSAGGDFARHPRSQEARGRVVEALEEVGSLVLDGWKNPFLTPNAWSPRLSRQLSE
jgi:hypothetical protein